MRVRAIREPLQYLCNLAHWRDVTLAVGPGVLIPRPETELLVEFAEEVRMPSLHARHVYLARLQIQGGRGRAQAAGCRGERRVHDT